ncbi:histidyl-tRNA synthetase [Desulfocarbo indianensis]|nr:histidyl-tRNA synthetase [Desulfocarbo indianensis]
MKDVWPEEARKWQRVEALARQVFHAFGFGEIKTPVLEKTELFARSIGEATDIVEKEMYTFADRSGDSLTMRPEATAGLVRAYIESKNYAQPGPHKLFLIGPMFRHERPQKGRLRQFHQIDVEVLGDEEPQGDAEIILMLDQFLKKLGLGKVIIKLNSLGCPACRPGYRQALLDFLGSRRGRLCEDCRRRLDTNPLRVLDCKAESCQEAAQGAPNMADHLCEACQSHFAKVRQLIGAAGVDYELDPRLVRGLDYYIRTTFEAVAGDLGAQNAVAGGGRYDGLIEALGGPAQGGIGFAFGLERLSLLLPDEETPLAPELYIAALGEEARDWSFSAAAQLRGQGVWVELSPQDKSLKAQLRRANKLNAAQVLIIGPEEIKAGRGQLKDMAGGGQEEIPLDQVAARFAPPSP